MGTRGFIIVKFRNTYYKIYNHWDSYPSELGKKVIDFLKTLQEHNELEPSEECLKAIIQYFVTTCKNEVVEEDGQLSVLIEWIYKMDLDQLQLTVENWDKTQTFPLSSDLDAIFHEMCKMGH